MAEFVMPILGADMSAGTLVEWKKRVGDRLRRGDVIAEVETDKGAIEVEVFVPGVIERLLVEPGAQVPVGTPMAIIREEGREEGAEARREAPGTAPPPGERPRVSPAARKLARERGVDVAGVRGSGPGGAITLDDIERSAKALPGAPSEGAPGVPSEGAPGAPSEGAPGAERIARMRQTIAAAMARSKREIPHYYLATTIDMKPALDWLSLENQRRPMTGRLLPALLLLKAVALALREVPELNAVWEGGTARTKERVHVGVAIALRQGGLIAPALHDTDRRSLDELMVAFRDLVERARAGALRSSELSDATITVTNLGEQGAESTFGVIYPPQVAIVGFGRIAERPWVVDGGVVARPVVTATLSADHRVTDGHRGGRFLAAVARILQQPEKP